MAVPTGPPASHLGLVLDAMFAVAALAGIQHLTTWGTVRSRRFARLVKPEPQPLLRGGNMLEAEMTHERITEDELKSALRHAGLARFDAAEWVVLETNGQFSVIPRKEQALAPAELLDGVVPARTAPLAQFTTTAGNKQERMHDGNGTPPHSGRQFDWCRESRSKRSQRSKLADKG